jgi:hypothetical protein
MALQLLKDAKSDVLSQERLFYQFATGSICCGFPVHLVTMKKIHVVI